MALAFTIIVNAKVIEVPAQIGQVIYYINRTGYILYKNWQLTVAGINENLLWKVTEILHSWSLYNVKRNYKQKIGGNFANLGDIT